MRRRHRRGVRASTVGGTRRRAGASAVAADASSRRCAHRADDGVGSRDIAGERAPEASGRRRLRAAARRSMRASPSEVASDAIRDLAAGAERRAASLARVGRRSQTRRSPIPTSNASLTLQPARPVTAGALAAGLACAAREAAALVRPPRTQGSPWQLLKSDTVGRVFRDRRVPAACRPRRRGDARRCSTRFVARRSAISRRRCRRAVDAPDAAGEAARAEALDRICADLDVQIGLTLLKTGARH